MQGQIWVRFGPIAQAHHLLASLSLWPLLSLVIISSRRHSMAAMCECYGLGGELQEHFAELEVCKAGGLPLPEQIDMVAEGRRTSREELTSLRWFGSVLSPHALADGREQVCSFP